jgi:hypothetical protein
MIMGLVLSGSAHADDIIHLAPIARTDDGKIAYMNQYEAEKYCQEHGMSLPTAYDLARAFNPQGVSKTKKAGFKAIYKEDGSIDFYYNASIYPGPSKDEDRNWFYFWSSSVDPAIGDGSAAYVFKGRGGSIAGVPRGHYSPTSAGHIFVVRCNDWMI